MKKILAIALCAAMILSMTACDSEKPDDPVIPENAGIAGGEPTEPDDGTVGADIPAEEDETIPPEPATAEQGAVESLEQFLTEKEQLANHYTSDGFADMYEHEVKEYWIYELKDGKKVFLRLFDSEETAQKEASNYENGDPSKYVCQDGELTSYTIIDYATPVWLWRYGSAIIEFGSFDDDADATVKLLIEKLGSPFAGGDPTVELVPVEDSSGTIQDADGINSSDHDSTTVIRETVDLGALVENAGEELAVVDGGKCEYEVVPLAAVDLQQLEEIVAGDVTLISSSAELSDYCSANKEALSNDESKKALDKYDDEYFDSSSLLLVPLMSANITQGFRLNEMKINQKNIILDIQEDEGIDDALDFNLMIVGLKNVKFDKLATKIKANRTLVPVVKNPLICDGLPLITDPNIGTEKLDFDWKTVRTDGDGYPANLVINSKSELDEYYEHRSAGWSSPDRFRDAIAAYTDEWFKSHTLIIAAVEYGSGSIKVFAERVERSGNEITVKLRAESPEVGTCDMAGWQVLVEIPKLTGGGWTVNVEGAKGVSRESGLATE